MSICGKIIYSSKTEAANSIAGSNKAKYRKSLLNCTYYCEDCNGWHTSSGGNKKKKRMQRKQVFEVEIDMINKKTFREARAKSDKNGNETLRIKNFTSCR